tara:strand:+ start:2665 stop:5172 length:2508 start_codon:yes stop_codon:yes gene_type:complete
MGTLTSTETDRLAAYTVGATASTGPFPITFPFADNDDIAVYVNGTKISTYGVTQGSAYGTSGNFITLQTGVTNSTVSVVSEASAVRSTTDSLTLTALNGEIDNIYANLQENQFDKTRSMNAPLTDPTTSNMTLPSHTARAGRLLSFNSTTGNPEAGPDIASVSTVTQISADIGTVAGISSDVTSVAGISSSVTSAANNSTAISSVAGIASNVTTVAGIAANITAVAGKTTEITDLGTSANITNMATLGASGVVSNIATVAGVSSELAAAGTNATNAAASALAAANSAAAAAASFDTFDDRYLGSKSSEPSVDNDGNALVSGALFFDSSVGSMKVFDGGNWILATSAGAASLLDYEFTATAGQTTFTGSDNNSATLSYTAGNLIVTLNGIVLDNGSDYTATSGTSIVLASGAALNDHLAVIAFKSFTVADTVAASTGGTFAGNVAVTGNISVTGTVDGRDVAQAIPATLGSAGQVLTVNGGATAAAWASPAVGFAHTLNSGNPTITINPSAVGHMWVNTTSGETFVCTDVTNNANVWVPIGRTTGGTIQSFSATGGVVSTFGSYTVHTFLSSGNFVTTATKDMEYLIVGGGGGGGQNTGGGGGAGGLLHNVGGTALSLLDGTHPIVVGAGGGSFTAGSDSSAFSLTSIGGGRGGSNQLGDASGGGSGGGAAFIHSSSSGQKGAGTAGQGNDGGGPITWNNGYDHSTAGGGGAGAAGGLPSSASQPSGAGGAGLQVNIDGNNYYYAAGGGGASYGGTAGNGGIGGGGAGAAGNGSSGTSGTGGASALNSGGSPLSGSSPQFGGAGGANTGSGGGGGAPSSSLGGAGGSGIVIIRYLT